MWRDLYPLSLRLLHRMTRRLSRWLAVVLLVALAPTITRGQASTRPSLPLSDPARVAGWRADLDTLVAAAQRLHAGPTRPAHSAAFTGAVRALSTQVPTLTDARVTVEVQRLLARLGDGHSLVYPMPSRVASFAALPFEVHRFSDGLFVVGVLDSARVPLGARIERMGGVPTATVLERMAPYVSRDNAMGLQAFASLYLVLPDFLAAWGVAVDTAPAGQPRVALTVRDTLLRTQQVTLTATGPRRTRRRLVPPPATPASDVPRYLRDADRVAVFGWLPDVRAVYLQLNQMMDGPGARLVDIARHLGDSVRVHDARALVVDVRHNTGGNNQLIGPLIDAIAAFADADPARRVVVLTGRATFSAAQNFINRVERRVPRTRFAGEPSMSSPNFTGEDNPVRLPWSGLMLSISNRYWQDSRADDRRPWIAPHLPGTLRMTDWLHNRDPVLDTVISHLRRR